MLRKEVAKCNTKAMPDNIARAHPRLSVGKGHMLRIGIAIAGDLLRESIRDCLVGNPAMETCAAYSVRQVMSLLQERQLDVLILDDQFDHSTWIGHLVSSF